ncbi:hypothetical protein HU200_051462 [Digitaria exilis]|uniref:Uncharacterized protein n=1 Tax=Digitaria exilis TaxID=1010633 RepID=A0A835E7Y3_9POAL|nr:hypothetical protein HU200_051462 [Digitaria exilis]
MSSTTPMASLAVLVSLFVCATTLSSSGAAGVRVELTRIHSVHGVNASQSVRDALRGDMHRHNARRLVTASGGATVSAPTQEWSPLGAYLMTLAIDTGAAVPVHRRHWQRPHLDAVRALRRRPVLPAADASVQPSQLHHVQ